MRFCTHHGAAEIGGNCVELECEGQRLLLDLETPLEAPAALPPVPGLLQPDPTLLGVVLSHAHLDHYGMLPQARAALPVWLGEGAIRLLAAAAPFTRGARLPQRLQPYWDRQPFTLGPFTVTPFLVDHSAYDAYALLVEAGGRRLFYSGDLRGHGRKAWAFERLLASPPANIDLLLLEGTTLGRQDDPTTERDVEAQAAEIMRASRGMVLTCFSAQNVDRFVSFYRACVRTGRTFVIDAYTANIITALELQSLPQPASSPHLRVFLPANQRRSILASQRFDFVERYRSRRIYPAELAAHPGRFAIMFRASTAGDLRDVDLAGGALIYAVWPGYLERDRTDLRAWAAERQVTFHLVHSSGHASPDDLKRLVDALGPRRVTPIHTDAPHAYGRIASNVQPASNGQWVLLSDAHAAPVPRP